LRGFGMVMVAYVLHRILISSSITAAENLSYQVSSLDSDSGKPSFGKLRLWGSVGFGLTAVIGGWLLGTKGILINDQLFLGFMLVSIGIILFVMPDYYFSDGKAERSKDGSAGLKKIVSLIFQDRYLFLTVLALALTDPLSDGIRSFEPIFMKDLGLTESIIGAAVSLSCFTEVPVMLLADRWIQKFEVHQLVYFILIFDLSRRLLVWFFPFGWLVFALNVLTAVSFTLRLITAIHLINLRVPKQYTTTAVTFVNITLNGIFHMLSNALSGVVYDNFGGRQIYLVSACFCVIALVIALAAKRAKAQENDAPALI
jgi:predicted MFS family arabinose efflux permease